MRYKNKLLEQILNFVHSCSFLTTHLRQGRKAPSHKPKLKQDQNSRVSFFILSKNRRKIINYSSQESTSNEAAKSTYESYMSSHTYEF